MAAFAFDTHATIKRLKEAGMPENQAEAVVVALNEMRDTDIKNLVTKTDLKIEITGISTNIDKVEQSLNAKIDKVGANLKADIREVEQSLNTKIDKVEQSLNAKIDKVEQSLNAKIDKVEQSLNAKIDKVEQSLNAKIDMVDTKLSGNFNLLKWMSGFTLAAVMAIFYMIIKKSGI